MVSGLSLKLFYAFGTPFVAGTIAEPQLTALPETLIPKDLPPPPVKLLASLSKGSLVFSNFPNPITDVDTTTFAVSGPMSAFVEAIKVQIFDLSGRLVYEQEESGVSLDWHTENDYGEHLANGVYLYKIYALINSQWVESDLMKLAILR